MPDLQKSIDVVRYQINRRLNLDVVRASGQHTLRTHMLKVMGDYGIEAVIDIGANEGGFGSLMRVLGFRGEIYSFEPVAEAFAKLARLAANDEKWHVHNFALGSSAGESLINVSKFSQYSSILSANEYGNSFENMAVRHQQSIQIKTLDACFAESLIPHSRRLFLKMDTQGFDLEVFKGALNSLAQVRCMLSELSLIPIYHGMPSYLESLALYQGHGFAVSGFYPVTRNANLALNEVDCMLVNVNSDRCPNAIGFLQ